MTTFISNLILNYGIGAYIIIFIVLFIETGIVITPFLPGDSLLFLAGTFLVISKINPIIIIMLFSIAAITGDFVNYFLGRKYGLKLFSNSYTKRLFKEDYLIKTENFFEKHGNIAIFLGRFIPIIRTFIPFTSGIARMSYKKFITYNMLGGLCWVSVGVLAGYFFGSIEIVKKNFELIMMMIVVISLIPVFVTLLREKVAK